MKVIIVGGGAAGASCAARLRRLNEDAEIIIIEKTNEVSIANCGLPYYVSGVINEREKILVSTPEKFKSWFNIDILLNTEVINIMPDEKKVFLSNGEEMNYDKLVLAQGASPIVPPFEGMDKDKTFIVRNLNDADKIKNYIQQNNSKKAVVVGGGFIGIEMAENLRARGLQVDLAESMDQVMAQAPDQADALMTVASGIASFSFVNLGMSIIERTFAVLFHIGASIIVFYACKDKGRFWLYPLAILLHTAMDFTAGLTTVGVWKLPVWALEGIIAIFGVLTFCGAFFLLYKKDVGKEAIS